MVRFGREDFSGGERRRFKENYRSVKEVVSLFDRFASDMATGDYDSGLDAQRGSSGLKPELCTVDQAHQQPVAIADTIEAMCTLGKRYSDQAVLCSGNEKLSNLAQDLERLRIAAQIAVSDKISDRSRGIALWQLMNFIRTQPSDRGLPIMRLLARVCLMRLGDDRDLRQLPSAAQSLDAVRLMTIHGAKGLEFAVVHLPGLNNGTLPRSAQQQPCPPPDGMVEGGYGTAGEIFRTEHDIEQECLFYVALSRARDRLFLYAPTKKANSHQWSLSPFLERLWKGLNRRHVMPDRVLSEMPEDKNIELVIEGDLRFSASQIGLYESCPRRFFYTHVLQLGGRRGETALMQMHEVVRTVTQALIAEGATIDDNLDLEKRIWEAMIPYELTDHGSVEELKIFAMELIQYFVATRTGYTPESPTTLSLTLGDEEIIVKVDDVLVGQVGKLTLRRVRTGHMQTIWESWLD